MRSMELAIHRIINEQVGRIDVLVNNAGYALVGPLGEISYEEIKEQFETNFFGYSSYQSNITNNEKTKKGNGSSH